MPNLHLPLLAKAKNLPTTSGCYLMKNHAGEVLYVGKAKNLRARVSSYFRSRPQSAKTSHLVASIGDFDFILAGTETEAFILENNLIKRHRPKYNILLRDDKSYPYVVADHRRPFPRLVLKRRPTRGPNREIFGPFAHVGRVGEVLGILVKMFQLRDCSLREFRSRTNPCLLYQMQQCSAPCVGHIGKEEYRRELERALQFFRGRGGRVVQHLREKMDRAAAAESYEWAAILRDSIQVLTAFLESAQQKNAELHHGIKNLDVVAYDCGEGEVGLSLYMVRHGMLLGHKDFHFPFVHVQNAGAEERQLYAETQSANLLFQYYSQAREMPPQTVVVPFQRETLVVLKEALANLAKIKVCSPGRRFASLVQLTHTHAVETMRIRMGHLESALASLRSLQRLLSLKDRPKLIECYDVAIFQGSSPTASGIVFERGRPCKERYRHYHLKARREGNNDFAMLREVLERRLEHGDWPAVFVVDGGRAQANVFSAVLQERGLSIPVIGIAKAKAKEGSVERLFLPGRKKAYPLGEDLPLLRLITHLRDEAHRFARRLHHRAEKKRLFAAVEKKW